MNTHHTDSVLINIEYLRRHWWRNAGTGGAVPALVAQLPALVAQLPALVAQLPALVAQLPALVAQCWHWWRSV
jgi:hypothetical protein